MKWKKAREMKGGKIQTERRTHSETADERQGYVRDEEGSGEGRRAQREDEREWGRDTAEGLRFVLWPMVN